MALQFTSPSRVRDHPRRIRPGPLPELQTRIGVIPALWQVMMDPSAALPHGWAQHTPPLGDEYFLHTGFRCITTANIRDPLALNVVENAHQQIMASLEHHSPDGLSPNLDIYIEPEGETILYYVAHHDLHTVWWITPTLLSGRHRAEYWIHVGQFPNHVTIDRRVKHELVSILSYESVDDMTDQLSTACFSAKESGRILKRLREWEQGDDSPGRRRYCTSYYARVLARIAEHRADTADGLRRSRGAMNDPIRKIPRPLPGMDPWQVASKAIEETTLKIKLQLIATWPEVRAVMGTLGFISGLLFSLCAIVVTMSDGLSWTPLLVSMAICCMYTALDGDYRMVRIGTNVFALAHIFVYHVDGLRSHSSFLEGDGAVLWLSLALGFVLPVVIVFVYLALDPIAAEEG